MFGKSARIPGSLTGDDELPTHAKARGETSEGLRFGEMLARRETARRAFHSADNDMSLRRAALRRERPHRGSYEAGEWVMVWRVVSNQGSWYEKSSNRMVPMQCFATIWDPFSKQHPSMSDLSAP